MGDQTVTLEPIHGLTSRHIVKSGQSVGLLIPPQRAGEEWEIWLDGEWIAHRFASETEALASLGINTEDRIAA